MSEGKKALENVLNKRGWIFAGDFEKAREYVADLEADRNKLRNALSGLIVKIESMAFNDQHKPPNERTRAQYLTRRRVFEIAKAVIKDTQP